MEAGLLLGGKGAAAALEEAQGERGGFRLAALTLASLQAFTLASLQAFTLALLQPFTMAFLEPF